MSDTIFDLFDGVIVEVIIVIMGDDQIVKIWDILRLICRSSLERFIDKRDWRATNERWIYEKFFPIKLHKIGGVSQPNEDILFWIKVFEIGFDRGDFAIWSQIWCFLGEKFPNEMEKRLWPSACHLRCWR